MAHFMIQATYTPEAWGILIKNPQNRREAICPLVEKAGGKMLDLFFSFGENDIIFFFEAPDALAAAAISVAGNIAGHIRTIKTTQVFTVEESMELIRRTAALGPAPAPTAG